MRIVRQGMMLAVVLATILSGSGLVFALQDGLQVKLREYLEMGPAATLKLTAHGLDAGEIDKRLSALYKSNDLKLFWIEGGKPGTRATAIRTVLSDAASHGLNPDSYFVKNINSFWQSEDDAGLVQLDILLSLGMMRYLADQREGRIEPRQINPKLFATARDVKLDYVTLRKEAFAAQDLMDFLKQQAPPFYQYRQLQKYLATFRKIAADGGWPAVPDGPALKPGIKDPRIQAVRKRLMVTGELGARQPVSDVFDDQLAAAVKRFQKYHGLSSDGVIGKQTLHAMNVPVESRIMQIIINMERYRWVSREGGSGVWVNIAGFELYGITDGTLSLSMPVIVGREYHQTPVFSDTIKYVDFNPFWTLTPNIARNETLPKLQADPTYLKKHDMRLFDGWGNDSAELDPASIDWSRVTKKQMDRYRVRQDPGPKNALGTLKIIFPNDYDVYLHDTPAHELFKKDQRAFSHGCIRMSRPAETAAFVLGGEENGWTVERVNKIVQSRKRQIEKLKTPMPVHILYRTSVIDPGDGSIYFYNDLYGRDKLLAQALFGAK